MNRDIAERLVQLLTSLDVPLGQAAELLEQIPDVEERTRLRKGIGRVLGEIYLELLAPIAKQYPDLDKAITGDPSE